MTAAPDKFRKPVTINFRSVDGNRTETFDTAQDFFEKWGADRKAPAQWNNSEGDGITMMDAADEASFLELQRECKRQHQFSFNSMTMKFAEKYLNIDEGLLSELFVSAQEESPAAPYATQFGNAFSISTQDPLFNTLQPEVPSNYKNAGIQKGDFYRENTLIMRDDVHDIAIVIDFSSTAESLNDIATRRINKGTNVGYFMEDKEDFNHKPWQSSHIFGNDIVIYSIYKRIERDFGNDPFFEPESVSYGGFNNSKRTPVAQDFLSYLADRSHQKHADYLHDRAGNRKEGDRPTTALITIKGDLLAASGATKELGGIWVEIEKGEAPVFLKEGTVLIEHYHPEYLIGDFEDRDPNKSLHTFEIPSEQEQKEIQKNIDKGIALEDKLGLWS